MEPSTFHPTICLSRFRKVDYQQSNLLGPDWQPSETASPVQNLPRNEIDWLTGPQDVADQVRYRYDFAKSNVPSTAPKQADDIPWARIWASHIRAFPVKRDAENNLQLPPFDIPAHEIQGFETPNDQGMGIDIGINTSVIYILNDSSVNEAMQFHPDFISLFTKFLSAYFAGVTELQTGLDRQTVVTRSRIFDKALWLKNTTRGKKPNLIGNHWDVLGDNTALKHLINHAITDVALTSGFETGSIETALNEFQPSTMYEYQTMDVNQNPTVIFDLATQERKDTERIPQSISVIRVTFAPYRGWMESHGFRRSTMKNMETWRERKEKRAYEEMDDPFPAHEEEIGGGCTMY